MARINIEDSIFKENEYAELCIAAGGRIMAMGALTCLFLEAQKYYLEFGEIPLDKWQSAGLPDYLLTTGWAERSLTGVKVRGQDEHFAWLKQAKEAGKASAKARKLAKNIKNGFDSVQRPLTDGEGISTSFSSSNNKKENTTTTKAKHDFSDLPKQIEECWKAWNETLAEFKIKPKNISPADERTISQAILKLGFDRTKNALIGKRYEEKGANGYDPKSTLSLDYCLSRNEKTKTSNHERLENLALANASKHEAQSAIEQAEHIAIHGRAS